MHKQGVQYKLPKSEHGTCRPKNISVVVYDTASISKRCTNEKQNDRQMRVVLQGNSHCLIKLLCWHLIFGAKDTAQFVMQTYDPVYLC
jgi:hypothetical protein